MEAYKHLGEDVVKEFGSDQAMGLTDEKATENRAKYGANELTKAKSKSIFKRIIEGLCEPMMVILLVALGITIAVNIVHSVKGGAFDYVECIGIFIAIGLSVAITVIMEGRSAKSFEALSKIGSDIAVKVKRGGQLKNIKYSEIVAGDIITLGVGDKIPVDGRLLSSGNLKVDEAPLTGESVPVKKNHLFMPSSDKAPLAERHNMVYGGTYVTGGSGEMVVTAVGDHTEIGVIAGELAKENSELTPIQLKLARLGKTIALIGGLAAAVVFVVQFITLFLRSGINFDSVSEIFITSIVLIVASVPEGLPTIVAVSLALNVIKMAKQSALVKKMVACETVGCISVICSDKTGTLTENKMTVEAVYESNGKVAPEQVKNRYLLNNFCINSTANVHIGEAKVYEFVGNPTECAMLVCYNKTQPDISYLDIRQNAKVVYAYPFSSEEKKMSTVVEENGGKVVYVKGAPELILDMCEISSAEKQRYLDEIALSQKQAKRVIGLAHGYTKATDYENNRKDVERNLVFDGFVIITDPIRKEVYEAVERCRKAGVTVKMLTGDNIVTAAAIAKELKIVSGDSEVFSAADIENMSDQELTSKLATIKVVARSTPATKLRIVKLLKSSGQVVAVTGDGINDAPAIKNADVGIAMGITGTEVSKEASDIVLLDDSFNTIVKSVEWGRGIYENFQRFILFQLSVNLSAVLVVIVSILMGVDAPFNALELLWINLIMDGPPALTLGLEGMHKDLMSRKPTDRNKSIVSKGMLARIMLSGCFISLFTILQIFTNFMNVTASEEKTVVFTMFVLFQLFNAFNARELGYRSIFASFFKNKIMLIVMAVTFALQFVISQYGTFIFDTVPLDLVSWLKIIGITMSVVFFTEIYKLIMWLITRQSKKKIRVS